VKKINKCSILILCDYTFSLLYAVIFIVLTFVVSQVVFVATCSKWQPFH